MSDWKAHQAKLKASFPQRARELGCAYVGDAPPPPAQATFSDMLRALPLDLRVVFSTAEVVDRLELDVRALQGVPFWKEHPIEWPTSWHGGKAVVFDDHGIARSDYRLQLRHVATD